MNLGFSKPEVRNKEKDSEFRRNVLGLEQCI